MPTIRTNGIDTYYERRGSGPPIVFVHGAVVDLRQWTPQLDALSDEYTTIAYDVRGHGRTGGSDRERYSIELFADDLEALIDGLDLERPVLCGLSMGGLIAQVYATRHPDRIAGLVLADTFGPEILSRGEWLQRSALLRAVIPPTKFIGYERVEAAMVKLQEILLGGEVSGEYEAIQRMRSEGPKMATEEFEKVMRAMIAFADADVDPDSITVPTLVCFGEHDAGFVHRHVANFGSELPKVTLRKIPDAGHVSNVDNAEVFTDELEDFLAGLDLDSSRAGRTDAGDVAVS